MPIRKPSDLLFTAIAWFPLLAVIAAVAWVLSVGAMNLETKTNGSQIFVSNQAAQTPDHWKAAHDAGMTMNSSAADPSLG